MIKVNLKQNVERKTKTREEMKNLKGSNAVILEHCECQHEKSAFESKIFSKSRFTRFCATVPIYI